MKILYKKCCCVGNKSFIDRPPRFITVQSSAANGGTETPESAAAGGGVVMVSRVPVNMDSVIRNMYKSEKARLNIESKLKTVEGQYGKNCLFSILPTTPPLHPRLY